MVEVQVEGETDKLVGKILAGRYRVAKMIGEGGMGRVYLAEQKMGAATRKVAIKTLHPELSQDPQLVARFHRECETVIELSHPNTIQFYDFGELDDKTLYVVMEFIEGESLASVLSRGPLDFGRIDRILMQICGSLGEAHERGIIHRDLKPENVLLTTRGGQTDYVKVLDFGIAKRSEAEDQSKTKLTKQGMVLGTPPYMSPEQFSGQQLDARSDIYSLGIMVYEMLTGRLPFEGKTPWEWATKHLTAAPAPLELTPLGLQVPPQKRNAVMRALAKDREARHATVLDFVREFTGYADPQAVWTMSATTGPNNAAPSSQMNVMQGAPQHPYGTPAQGYAPQQPFGQPQQQAYPTPSNAWGQPPPPPQQQHPYVTPADTAYGATQLGPISQSYPQQQSVTGPISAVPQKRPIWPWLLLGTVAILGSASLGAFFVVEEEKVTRHDPAAATTDVGTHRADVPSHADATKPAEPTPTPPAAVEPSPTAHSVAHADPIPSPTPHASSSSSSHSHASSTSTTSHTTTTTAVGATTAVAAAAPSASQQKAQQLVTTGDAALQSNDINHAIEVAASVRDLVGVHDPIFQAFQHRIGERGNNMIGAALLTNHCADAQGLYRKLRTVGAEARANQQFAAEWCAAPP